ncbi:MAG: hypothetical protein AAFR53_16310 [Pseudomonadota bacterium]
MPVILAFIFIIIGFVFRAGDAALWWIADNLDLYSRGEAFGVVLLGSFGVFIIAAVGGYHEDQLPRLRGQVPPPYDYPPDTGNFIPEVGPDQLEHRPLGWIGLKHGGHLYEFQAVRVGDEVRAYVLAHPDFGNLATDPHSTHLLTDANGNRYVCPGWKPETREEAKAWAAAWCKYTTHYVATGRPPS